MVIKHAARTRAKEDEEAEKKKVEGEGWQSLPAEGSFTCRRRAAFFYTFHIRPAHMPQAGACVWRVGGGRGVQLGGWDSRVVLFANMLPIRRCIDVCLLFGVASLPPSRRRRQQLNLSC